MTRFELDAVGEVEYRQQTGVSDGPEGSINLYYYLPEHGEYGKIGEFDCNESLLPTADIEGYEISIEIREDERNVPRRIGERESTVELRADYEGTTGNNAYFTLRDPGTRSLDTRQGLLVVPATDTETPIPVPSVDFVDDSTDLDPDWTETEPHASYYLVLELAVTADPFTT